MTMYSLSSEGRRIRELPNDELNRLTFREDPIVTDDIGMPQFFTYDFHFVDHLTDATIAVRSQRTIVNLARRTTVSAVLPSWRIEPLSGRTWLLYCVVPLGRPNRRLPSPDTRTLRSRV